MFIDRKRGQLNGTNRTGGDRNWAESDLTDDSVFAFGDKREQQIAFDPQLVDEASHRFAGERLIENTSDVRLVLRSLRADIDHQVLLSGELVDLFLQIGELLIGKIVRDQLATETTEIVDHAVGCIGLDQ